MQYRYKMRFLRIRAYLIMDGYKRTAFLVKHKVFAATGENFFFQPRIIPADPRLIKFGNNVVVGSGTTFINHDGIDMVLNKIPNLGWFKYQCGCIEVGDNVFIGANSNIMPNVKIGNNVIIAAGSVVTKDVPSNSVYGGVPAKKIMTFDEYVEKRRKKSETLIEYDGTKETEDAIWQQYYEAKKEKI